MFTVHKTNITPSNVKKMAPFPLSCRIEPLAIGHIGEIIQISSASSVNQILDVTRSIQWRNGKPCQHHNKFKWQRN